ncbi:MAG: hypothetical protein ACJ8FP_25060 [Xanthobacteraceae bacterium]
MGLGSPGSHVRAAIHNAIAVPIAIAGLATLLVAALASRAFVGAGEFQLHCGRFQKPGQMPYDLRDRGAEIAISNGVETGRGALRLLITDG